MIQDFWKLVHERVTEISEENLDFEPRLYILGDPLQVSHFSASDWILTCIIVGRQVLMRGWKTPVSPSFQDWSTEIGKVASYEPTSYRSTDRQDKY